jgi:large subunit ribosomal protein L17
LLRNLVTSLVKHEAIQTTYPKAKAAQRVAEKLITLAKRNNETSRRAAMGVLFVRCPGRLRSEIQKYCC